MFFKKNKKPNLDIIDFKNDKNIYLCCHVQLKNECIVFSTNKDIKNSSRDDLIAVYRDFYNWFLNDILSFYYEYEYRNGIYLFSRKEILYIHLYIEYREK
jgi:hypothetical protein